MDPVEETTLDGPAGPPASFPTRLLFDVVSAQLPPSLVAPPASETSLESNISGGEGLGTESMPSDASRPATGLSLAAIARAERDLDRCVTITGSGTHVAFSRADLERLRDPAVLRFMEQSAQAVPPQRDRARDGTAPVPARVASRVEADLLRLQREIDTFITAVDEEGRSYRILTNEDGGLVLPVADGAAPSSATSQAGDDSGDSGDDADLARWLAEGAAEGAADSVVSGGIVPLGDMGPELESLLVDNGEEGAAPAGTGDSLVAAPESTKAAVKAASARSSRSPVEGRGAARLIPSSRAAAGRGARPAPAATARPLSLVAPAKAVRPVRALQPEEETRVEALLRAVVEGPNPFAMAPAAAERVAAIDVKLSALRVVRRAARVEAEAEAEAADPTPDAPLLTDPRRGHRLGNGYLHEAREGERRRRALQAVNAQLLRLHREAEALAMAADATDLPADVLAMRPAWAAAPAPIPDEAIAEMLAEAAEEERRCLVLGVPAGPPGAAAADPYAPLLAALGEARRRAADVLATHDTLPDLALPMAPPSPVPQST